VLADIARIQEKKGRPYACVTDHVHADGDDAFLPLHVAVRDALRDDGCALPIFIGIEASIIDRDGHFPVMISGVCPDLVLAGEHWIPGTDITMDDTASGAAILAEMHRDDRARLESMYATVAGMYEKAMTRNHVDVVVHPFDTVFRMGDFDPAIFDLFGDVCDAAVARGVAIEINNKAVQRYVDHSPAVAPVHEGCMDSAAFYRELYSVALDRGVSFSFGSDAHVVQDIGDITSAERFARSQCIPESRILRLDPSTL
jgi:histidinol phosphatase-like PHP family hydrolase